MSKIYIEFNKDKDGNVKNIKLKQKGLLINRKYKLDKEEKFIKDIQNNKIELKQKNNKYTIDDINIIKKYSNIAKRIDKKNRIIKRTSFASLALASAIGTGILLGKKNEKPEPKITTETTTEDNLDEELLAQNDNKLTTEEATNENTTNIATENINNTSSTEEITTKEETKEEAIDEYVFEAEDRQELNDVAVRFDIEESINKYSEMYGVDADLITATVCQENYNGIDNDSDIGGYGLTQIENVHDKETIFAYNHFTKEFDEETIDIQRVRFDNDFAIKICAMLHASNFRYINNNCNELKNGEKVLITTFCYNKGIGTIMDSMEDFTNFDNTIKYRRNAELGDDYYIENVFRYLKNGTTITFKDENDNETSLRIYNKNATVKQKKR